MTGRARSLRLAILLIAAITAGCGGGGGGASGGGSSSIPSGNTGGSSGGGGGSSGGGGGGGSVSFGPFSNDEPLAQPGTSVTLSAGECRDVAIVPLTSALSGYTATVVSQYTVTVSLAEATNAQRCVNRQSYSAYNLITPGYSGFATFPPGGTQIPAGTYHALFQDGSPSAGSSYSNTAGAEISRISVPGGRYAGDIFTAFSKNLNPGGWYGQPFTIPSGMKVWMDGSSTGGIVVIMSASQYQSFANQYGSTPFATNGSYPAHLISSSGSEFCDFNSGDAPEDCDLTAYLGPGSYAIVAINNSTSKQAFAAFAQAYTAASGSALRRLPQALIPAPRP